ncbi:MAG: GTP-binding protein [Candidatus Levybacteria bacterium]|nr:GTP-binding protein [Candidatus Levybacteria bacterium]
MQQDHIRNFAIIAHVDHGKSTLSDRMLEITNTIAKDKLGEQFLDQNPISKERGITIKLAPVRMNYTLDASSYTLNLIDTPGHVDFSYEVSRTLAACEGAVLLVDATQGIQAQTVAHYREAVRENLILIPVINKIDLPNAQTETVVKELVEMFGFSKEEIIFISAKTGQNVPLVLKAIVDKIPPPKGRENRPLRALIFDAAYDEYRGVVTYVRIIDGKIRKDERVQLYQSKAKSEVTEVGFFTPYLKSSEALRAGEIGYVITGIKNIRDCRVGDTIMLENSLTDPLPGYTTPKPMVFFGVYPREAKDIAYLRESLGKLELNDTSLTFSEEYSAYLGSGYRVGFLGLLHAEIIKDRLKREFNLNLLFTMPQVLYEVKDEEMFEPYMKLTIYIPNNFVGPTMSICQNRKGNLLDMQYHESYAVLIYELPYSMFIRGLSAELKSASSGFASIDYEMIGYNKADLVNIEIQINGNPIDVLSEYAYKDEANFKAREKAQKLKDTLDRQQFRQIIQGMVNGNIIAREEIPPYRKDVLQKMSGGDRTRKDKLLEAQKKGKRKMLSTAKIDLPQEALFSMIENK